MIHHHSNFLEPEVAQSLVQKFENLKGTASFEINNMGRWGQGLEAGSFSSVYILPLEEYKDYFIEKYKKLDPIFHDVTGLTCFMHIWPPGSQINFHHDHDESARRLSSTIYLSENWNWNWGGFFLYDDPDMPGKQGWVYPHYNSMVWFEPPVWHSTSMVTMAAERPRLSVQLFFSRA